MWPWRHPFQTLNRRSWLHSLFFHWSIQIFNCIWHLPTMPLISSCRTNDQKEVPMWQGIRQLSIFVQSFIHFYHKKFPLLDSSFNNSKYLQHFLFSKSSWSYQWNSAFKSLKWSAPFSQKRRHVYTSRALPFFKIWHNLSQYHCTPSPCLHWIYWCWHPMVFIISVW